MLKTSFNIPKLCKIYERKFIVWKHKMLISRLGILRTSHINLLFKKFSNIEFTLVVQIKAIVMC